MHEAVIANKIIQEAKKQGAEKELSLEVGELCEIEAHELEEALENLVPWKLNVQERKSKIECACGYAGRARIIDKGHGYCVFNCPNCNKKPNVLEGGEIKIIGVG